MNQPETVGIRISRIRLKKGLTLDQLAERAGVSKSFLWEVEHDRSGISGERLLRVANALGASLDFLLRGEPTPQNYSTPSVEIPRELGDLAQEIGLSYRQTMALLDIERSIVARRGGNSARFMTKEEWQGLYDAMKQYLGEL